MDRDRHHRSTGTTGLRRLAVCVDDIGLHAGIDAASLRLHTLGRISAVSVLSEGQSWGEAAAALRDIDPTSLDVGLHINLTETVGAVPAVGSLAGVIGRAYLRGFGGARVRGLVERQLDRFEHVLGRAPAHVDGHQHVHQLPQVRDALLAVLTARYGSQPPAARPWVRACVTRPLAAMPSADARIAAAARKARIIEALGAQTFQKRATAAGFRSNGALLGVYGLTDTHGQFPALLAAWLDAAQDGDLLMCHPGHAHPGDSLEHTRQAEFDLLAGDAFGTLLREAAIEIKPLSQIGIEPARAA